MSYRCALLVFLSLLVLAGCNSTPPGPDFTYPGSEKSGVALNGNGYSAQTYATKDGLSKVKAHYEKTEGLKSVKWAPPKRLVAAGFATETEAIDVMNKRFERHTFQGENITVSLSAKTGAKSCSVLIVKGTVPD